MTKSKHGNRCAECLRAWIDPSAVGYRGHCYMFRDEPEGVCAQFKPDPYRAVPDESAAPGEGTGL